MSTKNIEAIILGRKNIGEADRLLLVYSKEEGKVKIIAKGTRKIKSKLASHIEPFTIGNYYLVEGKSFYILAGAEATHQNSNLSGDLSAFQDASYVCELLDLATQEGERNEKLYQTARYILTSLNSLSPQKRTVLLRYLEFTILESSGYKPNYRICKNCGRELTGQDYFYGNFEGVYCSNCGKSGLKISSNALKIMRYFEQNGIGKIIHAKNIETHSDEVLEVIFPYLCDILPRKPKSMELMI